MIVIRYKDGSKSKGIHPVHNFFGLKLRLKINEIHHGYIGAALMILGAWLMTSPVLWVRIVGIAFYIIGLYLIEDDLWQHKEQVLKYKPLYHSPVHVFIYDRLHLYDNKLFRKVNDLADKVFGRFKKPEL